MKKESIPTLKRDLTQEQLHKLIAVEVNHGESQTELLDFAKNGHWVKFIVDKNFNLILGLEFHEIIAMRSGVDRIEALVPDESFRVNPVTDMIDFSYTFGGSLGQGNVREAAESKIKEFLADNNLIDD